MTIIISIIILFLILYLNFSLKKNFWDASSLFLIENLFLVLVAFQFFFSEYQFEGSVFIWLDFVCLVFVLGTLAGNSIYIKIWQTTNTKDDSTIVIKQHTCNRRYYMFLATFICLGIIGALLQLFSYGFNLSSFRSAESFLDMNAKVASNRYSGSESSVSTFTQILLCFSYASPLLGGYLLSISKGKFRKMLCVLSMLPIVIIMLYTNTKAGFIASVFLIATGYIVGYQRNFATYPIISAKTIVLLIFGAIAFVAVLILVMSIRIGELSFQTLQVVVGKFLDYGFGEIKALDVWFANYNEGGHDMGYNTFMAVFNFIGIGTKKQGVYELLPGATSNVFTGYRGVIMDFGLIGGIIFYALLGLLSGIASSKIKYSQKSLFSMFFLMSVYFFNFYSFLISPWIYTSYILAFIICIFAAIIAEKVSFAWV